MNHLLLIFDLDGTLIDSRQDLCTGVNLMRRHYGLPPLPVETVSRYVGDGIRKLVARSLGDFPVNLAEAVRLNYQFYREHLHDETVMYSGVAEGLNALAQAGHTLALISNKRREACEELLRYFKVLPLFGSIVGGDSDLPLKPDPAAIRAVMQAAGRTVAETWMIGDHETDIAAARQAGVYSAFVAYGIGRKGLHQPTIEFASFADLTRYFLNGH